MLKKLDKTNNQLPTDRLWSVNEARQFLNISESTLRRMVSLNQVPFVRIGGRIQFRPESLDKYAAANESPVETAK